MTIPVHLPPQLPVVMRVPRFSAWAQNLCGMQFSILGYGDIIVPGEPTTSISKQTYTFMVEIHRRTSLAS